MPNKFFIDNVTKSIYISDEDTDYMTIAISIKVNDGIVLAADSAASMIMMDPNTKALSVAHVYQNAEKIFNLYKGLPIGVVTWGSGGIGRESVSTLLKDFRKLTTETNENSIDRKKYTIEDAAKKFKDFIYKKYTDAYKNVTPGSYPPIGFLVAGYSSSENFSEIYIIEINEKGECIGPKVHAQKNAGGISWNGQPEPIFRLIKGYSAYLPNLLTKMNVQQKDLDIIIDECRTNIETYFIHDAMPIQDAIDVANFLVELTINFFRFAPGAQIVGGPVDIAAITKHEGFKWVKRKHYYSKDINPEVEYEESE